MKFLSLAEKTSSNRERFNEVSSLVSNKCRIWNFFSQKDSLNPLAAWKNFPKKGASSLCLIQCRINHRDSCQLIEDKLTKFDRNNFFVGALSRTLASQILCPQLDKFIRKKLFFQRCLCKIWESFAYLASRIKVWKIRRSSLKPEKSKIWAFSGNRSLVCLSATIKVLLTKGLTSTPMWNFSYLETHYPGKKTEFSEMSALKPEIAEFSKLFCKTTPRKMLTWTGTISLKQWSI